MTIVHRLSNNIPHGNEGIVETFAGRLRKTTNEIHSTAQTKPFMKDLLVGNVTREQYAQYLVNLQCIYNALEKALTTNLLLPYIQPLYIPQLFRSQAIENDLKHFDIKDISPIKEAKDYVETIEFLSELSPQLLIAHAYTHYLEVVDVDEGQKIYNSIVGEFKEQNTKFYQFKELLENYSFLSLAEFANHYRELVNKLPLSPNQMNEIIEEVYNASIYTNKILLNL